MKTKSLFITLASITLTLTACGSNEVNRISGEVSNIDQSGGTSTVAADGQNNLTTEADVATSQFIHKGYYFTHSSTPIVIDADFAPILDVLGEPRSYFEAESCAFPGLDKIYTYNGFEIDTYPQPSGDFISSIVLKDDTVKTTEGLTIGQARSEMETIYGTPLENDSGQLVYEKDGMRLCFILKDNMIISIEYQTTVLDE